MDQASQNRYDRYRAIRSLQPYCAVREGYVDVLPPEMVIENLQFMIERARRAWERSTLEHDPPMQDELAKVIGCANAELARLLGR